MLGLGLVLPGTATGQYAHPFQDPGLPVEKRIDNLLSLMTLDEKVACLGTRPDIPRLGVKGAGHVEGLHGLAQGGPSNWGQRNPQVTTIFPQAIGLAESWDTALIRRVAAIEGYEARYMFQSKYERGGLIVRAPNADIGRDIRWGRTEECFGEDAWFNARMVVQFVRGLQGDHPKYWMTASLMKHFLANSNENGRDSSSSDFSERLFHEYYAYPFYKGITEGGSRAFMAAYNAHNGIPMTVHPVLKDVTIEQWGQDGIICTDGGACRMLVSSHHYYRDPDLAAAACLKAGINQFLDKYSSGVYGALEKGYLEEADLDAALRGVFRVMIRLGQIDPGEMVPYQSIGLKDTLDPWMTEKHRQAALEATRETIVLLKNDKQTLPLDRDEIRSIAVIGALADTVMLDWYSGTPPYRVTPLQGIRTHAGPSVEIRYARNNLDNRAVKAAGEADVAVVVVGNDPTCGAGWAKCPDPGEGKEAVDRMSITLKGESLVQQVYQSNRNLIVVLQSSFPYAINWTQENIPAIVHLTHCSQETGNALADVLFGDYNPAGRLVQTWPVSMDELPEMMDYDITRGRTYQYGEHKPLYPFGHGLSYSRFSYSNLKLVSKEIHAAGILDLTVDVSNNGPFDGDEVVQLYVSYLDSKIGRPNLELKDFQRIFIRSGETVTLRMSVRGSDLAYWNETKGSFEVEKGRLRLMLGTSSEDIRLSDIVNID